jgi:hypothetical protein
MRYFIISVLLAAACGDNKEATPKDAGADAAPDAAIPIGGCLDQPTDLPRPPSGQLPCELLPPGFGQ